MAKSLNNKNGNLRGLVANAWDRSESLSGKIDSIPVQGWVVYMDEEYGFNLIFEDPDTDRVFEITIPDKVLDRFYKAIDKFILERGR